MRDELALTLKNLFLPIFCKRCGQRLLTEENGFFCPRCWEVSPRIERPFCPFCGRPHKGAIGFTSRSNFFCEECRGLDPAETPYRRIYGAAYYADAVEAAVKLLKFHERPRLARPLAELMSAFAVEELDCGSYDFVIPVPLHRVRERARGYNQSRLLARELLGTFAGATLDESLRRVRPTRTQSRLTSPEDRRKNVAGAFAVEGGEHLGGKTVLMVDEVIKTRGTVTECAAALRAAGVATVDVLAAALAVAPYTPEPEPARPSVGSPWRRVSATWKDLTGRKYRNA